MLRKCIKCNLDKVIITEFYKDYVPKKEHKNQYRSSWKQCIMCHRARQNELGQEPQRRLKKQLNAKRHSLKNPRYTSEYDKNRKKIDPAFKVSKNLRSRISSALKKGKKPNSSIKSLGCTLAELKQHIETQWQSGMTWENYSRTGWHIDHIIPLSSFDLTNNDDFLKACHYTNLQPLWAKENHAKGATL